MIYEKKVCKYCNSEFSDVEGRWFSNHVRWCDKNTDYDNTECAKNLSEKAQQRTILSKGDLVSKTTICESCSNLISYHARERDDYKPRFCSMSCSNKRVLTTEIKKKISDKLLGNNRKRDVIDCLFCGKTFIAIPSRKRKFCSRKCQMKWRSSNRSNDLVGYRQLCKFRFNLADYPSEFDFDLVRKHGWYSAANRGNNLGGVSRDHMFSIKDGFEKQIDHSLIAHPANCKLLIHSDNISKSRASSITLEHLKERIANWESKYGTFVSVV